MDYNNGENHTESNGTESSWRTPPVECAEKPRDGAQAPERGEIDSYSTRDNVYTPGYTRYSDINRAGPYVYDREKGWQMAQDAPPEKYEWNFRDYDSLAPGKRHGGRNRGAVVFAVSLAGVLLVSFFMVTAYMLIYGGRTPEANEGASSYGAWEGSSAPSFNRDDVSLEITGKPPASEAAATVGGRLSIPEIARLVSPAVVGVSAHQGTRFYEPISIGSGIIMNDEGYIITNAHVVTGGAYFKVQLADDLSFDAVLVGADPMTDLAVLKIEHEDLIPAIFGDSGELEVGETVIAIGNPAGMELAGSVTQGIVSALNRIVSTSSYTFKYIQTDAAINPGNSGGALVNEYGQVIGINSSKIMAAGYEGIGFAIPISDAKPILDDIIANGRVTGRAMLGITCVPVSDIDARDLGVPLGLEIIEILPESDLAAKGAQQGDIITNIEGRPVYSNSDVQAVLRDRIAGDTVTLTLYRRITPVKETEFEIVVRLISS